jgi:hypothetical protein
MTNKFSKYRETTVLYCRDTGESEVVGVIEFAPYVSLVVEFSFSDGRRNHTLKLTLKFNRDTADYQTELYGRTFTSRGPRVEPGVKKMKQNSNKVVDTH